MSKRVTSELKESPRAKRHKTRCSEKTSPHSVPYAELTISSLFNAETGSAVKPEIPFESVALQTPDDLSVTKIGRGSKNGLRLVHSKLNDLVSREHAKIFVRSDGAHRIVDLGSHNGTYVNGNLIPMNQEWKLENCDCVSFGGPSRVMIGDKTVINPFRFVYHRLHSVEVWNDMRRCQEEGREKTSDVPEWLLGEVKCTICLETCENPQSVDRCGHVFCRPCILNWFCRSNQCPTCKQKIEKCAFLAITPCIPIRNMSERVHSTLTLDQVKVRGDHVRTIYGNLHKTMLSRRKANEDRVRNLMFSSGRRVLLTSGATESTAPSPSATRLSAGNTRIHNHVGSRTNLEPGFFRVPEDGSGDPTSVAPVAPIAWKVESTGVTHVARCACCGTGIPAKLFRITRTSRGTTQHFHPNVSCIGGHVSEIGRSGFDPKYEGGVTEQERRIASRLFQMIGRRAE